uniref:3-beta hydroxysteroid dehydrogenase/isomerase domain-containing protein n=1 Tax=Pelusios castaneus TaxID=367368 RepID=A0A8C8VMW3_9SAUR
MAEALVYLVTGGCGFIGEHIVQLLCKQDYVSEVRVFDAMASEEVKKLATGKETRDIRDYTLLLSAMRGVHVVIHTAAIVDISDTVPFQEMKTVNVAGKCFKLCGSLLLLVFIYLRGTEDTDYSGEVELPYGKTKAWAQKLVLEANGKKVSNNGGKLATCIIAPNAVYGEKSLTLKNSYISVKAKGGVLDYVEPEDTERNYIYVGNVAWMHVLAARSLQLKPDVLAGQVYYAYDDTPIRKGCLVRYELLSAMDTSVKLGSRIPYWKIWLQIYFSKIIKILLYPFWKSQPFLNLPLLNTLVTTFSYETNKAFRHFGYMPLYSWEESKRRTGSWLQHAGPMAP